ncbi:(2Fe-2S)-binding protein [Candidatus Bipolaricaulota bacterium]|nr:(2Fe-2S)-binding protein [Candidatus Bipolaricaulota bacterium]
MRIQCVINGQPVERDIDADMRLLDFIRETLHLTGTKEGCGEGECGACTVLMNGKAVHSCLVLAMQAANANIITVEGLSDGHALHPIQQAYVETGAVQCGFCTPGFIMATYALLQDTPDPSEEEILAGLEGNLCRCTGYAKILDAVKLAAERLRASE